MNQYPEAEEATAEQLAPIRPAAVDCSREADGNGDNVDHHDGDGRSAKASSSSSTADFAVSVNEISIPATTC
ncbi:hypothetical protein IEQ34_012852 [Dendrobium chrysotoxum]|uniref:Uncharacterized protein n=1 Tax=Dendrobium chrysotoxum TaxID=161865 RepID=A0AAV7GNE5_DENCH|nr:hypothetical protein IEQ34_012852 [Dendrobium chrysotoxum]